MTSIDVLARTLADYGRRLKALERAPRLRSSSLDATGLPVYDGNGSLRQVIGRQADGSYTVTDYNAPPPPPPSTPVLLARPGVLVVTFTGGTSDGSPWPVDTARIEVHMSTTPGIVPDASNQVASFSSLTGGYLVLSLDPVETWVVFTAVNTSGVPSAASFEVSATPLPLDTGGPVAPPDESPELSIYPTPRGFILQAADIVQGTLIDYHISTVDGFTPNPTTLWDTTASTVVNIETDAAGDALLPETDYYLVAVAHNTAGVAAPSSQVTGTLRLIDSDTIAELSVAKLVAGDMMGAFALLGSIQVGGITIEPTGGIIIPQPGGGTITLPADGSAATVTADLIAYSLTLLDNLVIRGVTNEVSPGAQLFLADVVSAPQAPPNVAAAWVKKPLFPVLGFRGLVLDSGRWYSAYAQGKVGYVQYADATTGVLSGQIHLPGGFVPFGGITKLGTNWYLFGRDYARGGEWYIYRFNTSWTKTGESWWAVANRTWLPSLGSDGTNLTVVTVTNTSGSMWLRAYPPSMIGSDVDESLVPGWPIGTGVHPGENSSGIVHTSADFGGDRVVATTLSQVYVFDLAGNRKTAEEWPNAGGAEIVGIWWDGTYRFWTLDNTGALWSYARDLGGSRNVGYTWYDNDPAGTGTHETQVSQLRTWTQPARAYMQVSTPAPADTGDTDSPNAIRVYVGLGGAALSRQADLGTGVTTVTYDVTETAGATPPSSNGFGSANVSSGALLSAAVDGAGQLIQLNGDGSARVGPFKSDTTGKATPPNDWVTVTPSTGYTTLNPVRYRLDASGNVHIRGAVNVTTAASGDTVFTLPTGFRPSDSTRWVNDTSPPGTSSGRVVVDPTGAVMAFTKTGTPTIYFLDGIFSVA